VRDPTSLTPAEIPVTARRTDCQRKYVLFRVLTTRRHVENSPNAVRVVYIEDDHMGAARTAMKNLILIPREAFRSYRVGHASIVSECTSKSVSRFENKIAFRGRQLVQITLANV